MQAEPETAKSVRDMLKNYAQAYIDRDLEGMTLFVSDPELVIIGSRVICQSMKFTPLH